MDTSELTQNQQFRLDNIQSINYGLSLLGAIAGVTYSKATGGGFWRGVGYWFLGGLTVGLATTIILTPFKNKILKEADEKK